MSTEGTAVYSVYNTNSYLQCLQKEELSTVSTVGTAIYSVYTRNSYLQCLQ